MIKELAPAVRTHPEARTTERKGGTVDSKSLAQPAHEATTLKDERMRKILREAVERFNNELLDHDERLLLLDRIKRLRRRFEIRA